MKNKLLLFLVSIAACLAGFSETTEPLSEPEAFAGRVLDAWGRFDFQAVAEDMHPRYAKVFRETTLRVIERCVVEYGEETIRAVLDLPDGLSVLTEYSDAEFLVHVLECVAVFVEVEGTVHCDVFDSVASEDGFRVLFRRRVSMETVSDPVPLYVEDVLMVVRFRGEWKFEKVPLRMVERYLERACRLVRFGEISAKL